MADPDPDPEPVFDKQKHIRYWLRMFKTVLPTHYQSTDSNRMFLAFTILSSLDILGVLHSPSNSPISASERADAVAWIYSQQHPGGGFRGFPGTDFGLDASQREAAGNAYLDPANAAGTSFALASLVVLRDDLRDVDGVKCARWLRRLQAEDGSFAEVLGREGEPGGKRDVRHSYFAVATRYVLGALEARRGAVEDAVDVDVEKLVGSVLRTQNYDGGISGEPGTESHGGYAYCAVGCLALLGELQQDHSGCLDVNNRTSEFIRQLIPNLAYRQVPWEDEDSDEDSDEGEEAEPDSVGHSGQQVPEVEASEELANNVDNETAIPDSRWVGFDGRCNKPADTCYTFWVGGTLAILGLSDDLIDPKAHRRFLLERTEHRIGGFGKTPGDPPDALHSFMGLLALSLMHEPGLEPVDASMAITKGAREYLEGMRARNRSAKTNEQT